MRDGLSNLTAFPSRTLRVDAGRVVDETVDLERTTVPWDRHPQRVTSTSSEEAAFIFYRVKRPLAEVPFAPPYFDIAPP
ncbi:MAG TPA: hypothetical protein VGO93_10790 [Candidatus Xenobia bacterium]